RKLMELDDRLAESRTAVAFVKFQDRDWEGGEREIQYAIKLNPNYALARHVYGFFLAMLGRVEESHLQYARALELDRASCDIATDASQPLIVARDYQQAIAQLHKALEIDPNYENAHETLADIYECQGKYIDAIEEYEKSETLSGRDLVTVLKIYEPLRRGAQNGARA